MLKEYKDLYLRYLVLTHIMSGGILIFVRDYPAVKRVSKLLRDDGYAVGVLCGHSQPSEEREAIMRNFGTLDCRIIVTTDASGHDLPMEAPATLINYHFPYNAGNYVRRIVESSQRGRAKLVISLLCASELVSYEHLEDTLPMKHRKVMRYLHDVDVNHIEAAVAELSIWLDSSGAGLEVQQ